MTKTTTNFRHSVTPDASHGWNWEVQEESFGKWHRVRHGWSNAAHLAETRARHAYEEEQERAAREELLA